MNENQNEEPIAFEETVVEDPVEEPTSQTVHDPVCHMDIPAMTAAGSAEYEGFTYYFCSEDCKAHFIADPAGVLERESQFDHSAKAAEMAESQAFEPQMQVDPTGNRPELSDDLDEPEPEPEAMLLIQEVDTVTAEIPAYDLSGRLTAPSFLEERGTGAGGDDEMKPEHTEHRASALLHSKPVLGAIALISLAALLVSRRRSAA